MEEVYAETDLLNIESVITKTESFVAENIDRYDDLCIERCSKIRGALSLPKSKQQKLLDHIIKINNIPGFNEYKVYHITSLINVILLEQKNIEKLSEQQLINFSLYLSDKPLDDFSRQASLMGSRTILDPLFKLTLDFLSQESILGYINKESKKVINWQDEKECARFQNETKEMLQNTDLESLLAKTEYEHALTEVDEQLDNIQGVK